MLNWVTILTACMVALVIAEEEKAHEYGRFGEWRKTLCEKKNKTIHEDIDVCFQTESKAIKEATADCINESVPTAEGSTVKFVESACEDKSAFTKFDKCMDEYESNIAYKKQMIVKNETVACYDAVLEKYGLQDLKSTLEEEVAAAHQHSASHE